MALWQQKLGFSYLLILCLATVVSSHNRPFTVPTVTRLTDSFPTVPIDQAFSKAFGASNVQFLSNGSTATLALDKLSGSGLVSQRRYYYGFFSAAIKLPSGLSPGVVVAFYVLWIFAFMIQDTYQKRYCEMTKGKRQLATGQLENN
ncbi:probable xyloglucan endotransglucosylase/hydrolase protein 33 [Vigna umbellata]|uniref:probable xyloglucan endotransglucosylase/hydrolase protein 33 n=1 Tax=Vigna umbellata TaxID=87088 RepID=UPI001F5EB8F3|nr:probable xyloglucan endotransglucosylase/hydrolase protein 33 [Vigna umbellata]